MKLFVRNGGEGALQLAAPASTVVFAIVAVCGLLDVAHSYVEAYAKVGILPGRPFRYCLYSVVLFWAMYAAVVPCVFFLSEKFRLDLQSWRRKLFIHAAAAMAFAYLHTSLTAILDPWRWHMHEPLRQVLLGMVSISFPIDFLAYWAIIGIAYALHFYSQSRQSEVAAAQLQANLAEAHLRSLRAQINPHFLFNTLNAVSALALKGEGKAVARALARFTGLLRINLDERYPPIITLARELEFIDNYLAIHCLLFGDRLVIERLIAPDVMHAAVPCMILQPLVENAIVHGISDYPGVGRITIEASRHNDVLCVRVSDNGSGFHSEPACRRGIGLANTRSRLEFHYGAAQHIEYGRSADGGACVMISIPFLGEEVDSQMLEGSVLG